MKKGERAEQSALKETMITIGTVKLLAILGAVWLAGYMGRIAQVILRGEWNDKG